MGRPRPAPSPPVGRAALSEELERLLAAHGSVLLTGPCGIGKTTLLEAVGARAADRGETVLRTAEVGGAHRPPRPDRPVLLLVDDVQWLDAESAGAVRAALCATEGRSVRALVAGRRHPGLTCSGDGGSTPWSPVPDAPHLPVPPLDPAGLAALPAVRGLPVRVVDMLHADSGGNPGLALELAAAFSERIPRHRRPAPLTRRVRALVADRLGRLPAPVRETLLTAALTARPTTDLLRRAGRADAVREVGLAADAALLLIEADGVLRFTPPAVGTVLTESAGAEQLARLHRELAEVVPDAAGRARHRALARHGPDARVARSLAAVAEGAARQGAHRTAAELYLLAAEKSPAEPAECRTRLLVTAAETGAAGGLPDLVHRAVEAVLSGDATRTQRVRARLAVLDLSGQGLAEMSEVFAAALVDAVGDPRLLGPLRLRMALGALVDGTPERAAHEVDGVLAHARAAGDPTLQARALALRANIALVRGEDHRPDLRRALRLPETPAAGRLHLSPRYLAAHCAVFEDRLTDARDELLRLLALVERSSGEEAVHVLRNLSEVSVRSGRCRDALDYADRAVRLTEAARLSPGPALYDAAVAELAGGSVESALTHAERGLRASEEEDDAIFTGRLLHVLGVARIRAGEVRSGVETLLRIDAPGTRCGIRSPLVLRRHGDLAAGLAELGDTARAEEVIEAARAGPAAVGMPRSGVAGQLDRAQAAVHLARGDHPAAAERLHAAVALFEALGQPLETGHCLLELARTEHRRGRREPARAAAVRALELFTRCAARPWAERARHRIRRLDGGAAEDGPPLPREVLHALTDSERRIVLLVSEGATNQQVAHRLFVSVKTVEASLTRVYRKLGVRSRAQLAALLTP